MTKKRNIRYLVNKKIMQKKRKYKIKIGIDIDNCISNFDDVLLKEYLKHDKELRKIQQNIQQQIETYIPSAQIAQIICKKFVDPVTQVNNLGIGFAIATDPTSVQNFFIFFQKNNGNVISKIVIQRGVKNVTKQ